MELKTFTFFWLTGESELASGYNEADAFRRAGYGGNALSAMDFIANGDKRNDYSWNKELHRWDRITPIC